MSNLFFLDIIREYKYDTITDCKTSSEFIDNSGLLQQATRRKL